MKSLQEGLSESIWGEDRNLILRKAYWKAETIVFTPPVRQARRGWTEGGDALYSCLGFLSLCKMSRPRIERSQPSKPRNIADAFFERRKQQSLGDHFPQFTRLEPVFGQERANEFHQAEFNQFLFNVVWRWSDQ
jgi:hypothetical protein